MDKKIPAAFTNKHNDMYEAVRQMLMALHGKGIPGLEGVITALTKSHMDQMKNSTTRNLRPGPASPPPTFTGGNPDMRGAPSFSQISQDAPSTMTPSFQNSSWNPYSAMPQQSPPTPSALKGGENLPTHFDWTNVMQVPTNS